MTSEITSLTLVGTGVAVGAVSHWAYFIRGEHHRVAHVYFSLAVLIPPLILVTLTQWCRIHFLSAVGATVTLVSSFWLSLWTSMVVYRALFHPLNRFPGPVAARITKLYHAYQVTKTNNFELMQELHAEYGPFVRVGPSELSVLHPDAVREFLGPRSRCIKAPWYEMGLPERSLHSSRDKVVHDKRRKIWDKGFSAKALHDFESRQMAHADVLANQIAQRLDQPLNVSLWFNFYSFDVMGELAFGNSFGMMETGEMHPALKIVHDGQWLLGYVTPLPWITPILRRLPGASKSNYVFQKWREEQIVKRKAMEMKSPDLMTWLLEESDKAEDREADRNWLLGDTHLIVVAGSDTTAATLTYLFYHLAREPAQVEKLRAELGPLIPDFTNFTQQAIQDAPHLNGAINETLRMYPPVPSGLLRDTPPEGLYIEDTFVPGNTTVSVPFRPLGHLETLYPRAEEFIPERWYSKPELLLFKDAFAPFSIGRYSCIGKNLALMEMRTVTALLLLKFDVQFAPEEDGATLLNNSRDSFTMIFADLNLVFSERKSTTINEQ